jgi:hypothetical protein
VVPSERERKRSINRAVRRGEAVSDPRDAPAAVERACKLLERRGKYTRRRRARAVALLSVLAVYYFFEGRAGHISPVEIVLPLVFWLGVHVLERRFQARVMRAAELNARLAEAGGARLDLPKTPLEPRLPRLLPPALATAALLAAASAGYATRPPPPRDHVHEAYVRELNRICADERARGRAVPMPPGRWRWSWYLTGQLAVHERALKAIDRLRPTREWEWHTWVGIRGGRIQVVLREREALAERPLRRTTFYRVNAETSASRERYGQLELEAGARGCG